MKTSSEGFQQCTNAQVTVDGKNQMIAATVVGRGATDKGQLLPMVDAAAATGGRMPAEVLADTVTATKRISPRWRHGESEAMWRWAGKAGSTPPSTATGGPPRTGGGNTWRRRKAGPPTPSGNGCRKRRTDGSSSRVLSVPCTGPEEGAKRMVPGLPCAEHSADVGPGDGLTGLARHPENAALHNYPRNP